MPESTNLPTQIREEPIFIYHREWLRGKVFQAADKLVSEGKEVNEKSVLDTISDDPLNPLRQRIHPDIFFLLQDWRNHAPTDSIRESLTSVTSSTKKRTVGTYLLFVFTVLLAIFGFGRTFAMHHNSAKIAKQILAIEDPLPNGWVYGKGWDIGLMKSASIFNPVTHVQVFVNMRPGLFIAPGYIDFADNPYVRWNNLTCESSGQELVGGCLMHYRRGVYHALIFEPKQRKEQYYYVPSQTGYINGSSGKLIVIAIFELVAKNYDPALPAPVYDPALVKPLFDHIKGIRDYQGRVVSHQ